MGRCRGLHGDNRTMPIIEHITIDDPATFSQQLASLREVAAIVGENAITQDEMDMAIDLIELLRLLNGFDRGLQ